MLVLAALLLVGFLVWQTSAARKTVSATESMGPSSGRTVELSPPLAASVEKPVKRLSKLSELRDAAKGNVVNAAGLVVEIVDRPGAPLRITLADDTGVAEVVCFTASDGFRARVRGFECMRLDARVDTYRGGFQLEPVAFSLVNGGSAIEAEFPDSRRPSGVSRYSDLREGAVVAVDVRVISATPTRSGGGMHGELELTGGDRVRYLWSDPPAGLGRAQGVRGYARVGSYEQRLQLRPFTNSARLAIADAPPAELNDEPAEMNDWDAEASLSSISEAMGSREGSIVRVRGIVADVIESEKIPFMVGLADSSGSVKVVIGDASDEIRKRLRAAAKVGEVLSLDGRINLYRGEKQLQPVDREHFSYLAGTEVSPPQALERSAQLKVGSIFRVSGIIEGSKLNRAGGLNGRLRIATGDAIDFIWWSPPAWACDGSRITGFARVGEFRGLQLEFTSSIQPMDR